MLPCIFIEICTLSNLKKYHHLVLGQQCNPVKIAACIMALADCTAEILGQYPYCTFQTVKAKKIKCYGKRNKSHLIPHSYILSNGFSIFCNEDILYDWL